MSPPATRHRARVRPALTRLRAVLASGLVLGVGVTVTLASWNDSEFANGSFTASVFDTQSSTTAGVWAHHPASPGGTLAFTAGSAMSPGASRYAWLNVRTTTATTVAGTIALIGSSPQGPLSSALEYRAIHAATAGTPCDANLFTTAASYIAGGANSYLAVGEVPSTANPTPIPAAGGELRFCFDVRVAPGTAASFQGTTATVIWEFSARSTE